MELRWLLRHTRIPAQRGPCSVGRSGRKERGSEEEEEVLIDDAVPLRRSFAATSDRPPPSRRGGVGGDVLLKIYDLAKPSEANGDDVGYLFFLVLLLLLLPSLRQG